MKTVLFVTRAQPFHLGHLKVIEWILKKYDKVTIVIGSSQESNTEENPFTFEERKKMIQNTLKSENIQGGKYEIIGIPDVHDDKTWVKNILKKAKFNVVFTKNSWTKRCFTHTKIPVKDHPMFGSISASEIRRLMKEDREWEDLVPREVKKIIKKIDLKKRLHAGIR